MLSASLSKTLNTREVEGARTRGVTAPARGPVSVGEGLVPGAGQRVERLHLAAVDLVVGEEVAALVAAAAEHEHRAAHRRGRVEVSPAGRAALKHTHKYTFTGH